MYLSLDRFIRAVSAQSCNRFSFMGTPNVLSLAERMLPVAWRQLTYALARAHENFLSFHLKNLFLAQSNHLSPSLKNKGGIFLSLYVVGAGGSVFINPKTAADSENISPTSF